METQYKLIFTGQLLPGFKQENVIEKLISISNMDKERAEKFLSGNRPKIVQKDISREKAEKFLLIFQKAGLKMRIDTTVPPPLPVQEQPPEPVPAPPPKPTPRTVKEPSTDRSLCEPRVVPASHGWHWLKSATALFLGEPWKWMGMAVVAFFLQTIVSILPFFGSIISSLLAMVFGGGLMLAANNQSEGKPFEFNYVFKGFHHNRNQLIMVGVIYLGGFIAIAMIIGLIMLFSLGASFFTMMGNSGDPEFAMQLAAANIPIFVVAMLLGMALSIPLVMGVWFATPLVAIHNIEAWTAFKMSIRGCIRNWLAFLIYGLVMTGFGLLLMIVMGGTSGLLATSGPSNTFSFLAFLPLLGMLLLILPLMVISGLSVFTSFKDIYSTNKYYTTKTEDGAKRE